MPRISDQRKMEIIAIFQASFKRDNSSEIAKLVVSELRDTDEMLGERDLNAGYRIALRSRIRELETKAAIVEQRKHESHIRAWNLLVGLIAGILVTVLGVWLSR